MHVIRKMKSKILYLLLLPLLLSGCSYLPEDELRLSEAIHYHETTEYIRLSPTESLSGPALIFLPGGLVDPHAYVSLMERIALAGTPVFILKMTANLAILESAKPLGIIEKIPEVNAWYISGHSLGGIAAQLLVQKEPESFRGLILMGTYPAESYSLADWQRNALSIYAENDELSGVEEIEANKGFLPPAMELTSLEEMDSLQVTAPATLYYMIAGGNHAQFGDYGFQAGDGTATISTEAQHEQISTAVTTFIQWNESL